jgi:hypothetical protein
MTGVIDFNAVQALGNAGQDFLRRPVRQGELLVGQQQKRFGAAAKKNIDPDAVRLGGELGLNEPERVGRAADVAPFDGGCFTEPSAMPLVEASSEFVANGLVVRRDEDDVWFRNERRSVQSQRKDRPPEEAGQLSLAR